MQYERMRFAGSPGWRDRESLLVLGSALMWGAVAVSVWSLLERVRERRQRHTVSNKLLSQVFGSKS